VQFPPRVPICRRCKVASVKYSVQTVDGPDHSRVQVQIYQCPSCEKLGAEEITSGSGAGKAA
jgi:hypothetical protein